VFLHKIYMNIYFDTIRFEARNLMRLAKKLKVGLKFMEGGKLLNLFTEYLLPWHFNFIYFHSLLYCGFSCATYRWLWLLLLNNFKNSIIEKISNVRGLGIFSSYLGFDFDADLWGYFKFKSIFSNVIKVKSKSLWIA